MSAYCTLADVKSRMSGDVPTTSADWDATITEAIAEISDMIDQEVRQVRGQPDGWGFLPAAPTVRRYTGSVGGTSLLLIDDATAVSTVSILDPAGAIVAALAPGADYLLAPLNGLPTTALVLTHGVWPWYPGAVAVALTPGYASTVPTNVRNAAIREVIRDIRGGQAGEDDRLGISPFGSVIVSKALLQSTVRMLARYRAGIGFLRG